MTDKFFTDLDIDPALLADEKTAQYLLRFLVCFLADLELAAIQRRKADSFVFPEPQNDDERTALHGLVAAIEKKTGKPIKFTTFTTEPEDALGGVTPTQLIAMLDNMHEVGFCEKRTQKGRQVYILSLDDIYECDDILAGYYLKRPADDDA